MNNSLSLYFHIPFCHKKCNYCAFYSRTNCKTELIASYANALNAQVSAFDDKREICSIYFGGGTPPLLGVDRLTSLLSLIKRRFSVAKNCETTIEINPKSIDKNGLSALFEAGFNRLSIGMQTAVDDELVAIGRTHKHSDTVECFENARESGFENISLDLIFALPLQTRESLLFSLEQAIKLSPKHISAYSLTIEENTVFYKKSPVLPSENEEEELYSVLCDKLKSAGYSHYEISSFCKDNCYSRHNTRYWQREDYFGFGAAAHSFYNNKRFSCPPDIEQYIKTVSESKDCFAPTDYYEQKEISEPESREERIMLLLRTDKGADISELPSEKLPMLINNGLAFQKDGRLILTEKGMRVSNSVIALLI